MTAEDHYMAAVWLMLVGGLRWPGTWVPRAHPCAVVVEQCNPGYPVLSRLVPAPKSLQLADLLAWRAGLALAR